MGWSSWWRRRERLLDVAPADIRVDVRRTVNLSSFSGIVEEAVATANHSLVIKRSIRKADSRSKDLLRRIRRISPAGKLVEAAVANDALIDQSLVGDQHPAKRVGWVPPAEVVIRFVRRGAIVPA